MTREGVVDGPKPREEPVAPSREDADRRLQELRRYFIVRGGCTVLINSETGEVRYCISKRVDSPTRLARLRAYTCRDGSLKTALRATYLPTERDGPIARAREPFALVHRGG
jgi:hypothetical protein